MTWLFVAFIGCGFAVLGSTILRARAKNLFPSKIYPRTNRCINILQVFWSMATAWCFFKWGAWYCSAVISGEDVHAGHFYHPTVLLGKLFQAVVLSLLGTVLVFVMDCIADSSPDSSKLMRANVTGVGIAIGFSWEQAFDRALENLVETKFIQGSETLSDFVVCFLLMIVIYPGWRLYILPKTSKRLVREVGKTPHIMSICFPEKYAGMYEESSEGESGEDSEEGEEGNKG